MFTGIIETEGIVKNVVEKGSNKTFWIKSPISSKLKVDQSLCHDGVCLTVEKKDKNCHQVTAVDETLHKSILGTWKEGYIVNLERSLKLNGRLDGHFVQGHTDTVGTCIKKEEKKGSWQFGFHFPENFGYLVIEKGSIAINGISLTVFNVTNQTFDIAIIPFTYENTNIRNIEPGLLVNLEFDMMGKYINKNLLLNKK
jgi:riboflavin synthase